MNPEEACSIHFFKWEHWEDHYGFAKERPVIFIEKNGEHVLCVPGSSKSQECDFSLALPQTNGDVNCKTYFSWENAVLWCSVCLPPRENPVEIADFYSDILEKKPSTYSEPRPSELFCKCDLYDEREEHWVRAEVVKSSPGLEELRGIPEKHVFLHKNLRYHIRPGKSKLLCKRCQSQPNSRYKRDYTFIKPDSANLNEENATMICDCDYPRYSVLKHRKTGVQSVLMRRYYDGSFELIQFEHGPSQFVIQPDGNNNLPEQMRLGESVSVENLHNHTSVGIIRGRLTIGIVEYYWQKGRFL